MKKQVIINLTNVCVYILRVLSLPKKHTNMEIKVLEFHLNFWIEDLNRVLI